MQFASGVVTIGFILAVLVLLLWTIWEIYDAYQNRKKSASGPQPQGVETRRPSSDLRGKHPTESEIVRVPSRRGKPKVFVSYRREDSADVSGRIFDRLVQAVDWAQFYKDVDSIPFGIDFRKHFQEMVSSCDVMLVVVGDRWLSSTTASGTRRLDDPKDFVRIELETALQRDVPVIPVLVRGASVPNEADLPPTLSTFAYRNALAVRADPDFHRDMDRLILSLKVCLESASTFI